MTIQGFISGVLFSGDSILTDYLELISNLLNEL
jgi:hypothetical protein